MKDINNNRIDQLTFTRFVASLLVVNFHFGRNVAPFNYDLLKSFFDRGNISVSYFFILSGFVMMVAYGNKGNISPISYFQKRFARIYPAFFLASLLMLLYLTLSNKGVFFKEIFLNLILLQAWIPTKALVFNIPAWSISVEFFFYALFPFLFNFFYSKLTFKKLLVPALLIWVLSQLLFFLGIFYGYYQEPPAFSGELMLYFPVMHLNEFIIGNIAGLFFIRHLNAKKINADIAILVNLLLVFLVVSYVKLSFHNGLLALLFVPLIILISINKGFLTKILINNNLIFLGEISYGIYILQLPVFYLCRLYLYRYGFDSAYIQFYIPLLVLLLLSGLSYIYFETPLRNIIGQQFILKRYVE
ncbi:MAG: acyltransferase family protein [Bacteroidia bacterium]|jgi:peptidoglycan/LPS O-acetylase OafA/YrhL